MNTVLMIAAVNKLDPDSVALTHSNGRPGDAAVVGPGCEFQSGDDLNGLVKRRESIFVQRLAVRQDTDLACVKIGQEFRRIKAVPGMIHFTHNSRHDVLAMDMRRLYVWPGGRLKRNANCGGTHQA